MNGAARPKAKASNTSRLNILLLFLIIFIPPFVSIGVYAFIMCKRQTAGHITLAGRM